MPKNPHIRNINYPFEQLFDLLMLLNGSNIADSDDPSVVDATKIHLQSVIEHSSSGVHAIGSLLGGMDKGDLEDHVLQNIGWLLAMLGELIRSSQRLRDECEQALAYIENGETAND